MVIDNNFREGTHSVCHFGEIIDLMRIVYGVLQTCIKKKIYLMPFRTDPFCALPGVMDHAT